MNYFSHDTKAFFRKWKGLLFCLFCLLVLNANAQDTITGKVTDNNGEGFPGATVRVQGTDKGTITDVEGNFTLTAKGDAILEVSSLGFITQIIPVNGRNRIDVTLKVDVVELEEVVVIGYGTQKKSHLTGAISKVTNKKLDQLPFSRVDDALVGKVSGVQIASTSEEGVGGNPTIRIRGVGSVSAESSPLVVIDGVPVDADYLGNIDMNDVESFEVLKDAASASIFGSRGANGVIMITTKDGKEGSAKFNYNGFFGFQEAQRNENYNLTVDKHVAFEKANNNGQISNRTQLKQLIGDTNWQDVFFNGGAVNSHTFSVRGGSSITKYSTSLSYLHDEGVLLTDDFKKYNLKAKINTKVNDRLSFEFNLNPSFTERRRFPDAMRQLFKHSPWLPLYHDENTMQYVDLNTYPDVQIGDYAQQKHFNNYTFEGENLGTISTSNDTNPFARVLEQERRDKKFKLYSSLYSSYKFNDNFSVKATFAASYQDALSNRYDGIQHDTNGGSVAEAREENQLRIRLVQNIFVNYDRNIGNHDINAVLGVSGEQENERDSRVDAVGFDFDFVPGVEGGVGNLNSADTYSRKRRLFSYIGRVNYAFKDKYLLSVSLRRDGSSVFGVNAKYGNFPAISAGWRISEEDFMASSSLLSNLKLRFSYGVTGNDGINTDAGGLTEWYAYQAILSSSVTASEGEQITTFNPANVANPDLQWERSIEFNPAIDFGIMDNRITGSVDYYRRTSDNLLLEQPTSGVSGYPVALVNNGEVRNEGVEFELRTFNATSQNFGWNTTFIASTNKNTLVDFGAGDEGVKTLTQDNAIRPVQWIVQTGNPISNFYGYVVDREVPIEDLVNPFYIMGGQAGQVYVKDLNGDGLIDEDDKTILGNPYPDFVWSISNEIRYKNFDFSFMFQGSHGAEVRNMGDFDVFRYRQSQSQATMDAPDREFLQPKIYTNAVIQDASYVALRNVSIGWTLPKSLLDKVKIFDARVYLSGTNLLYFMADDFTGFNPETLRDYGPTFYGYSRGGAPLAKKVVLGFNINF